jgi:hypothetical protein
MAGWTIVAGTVIGGGREHREVPQYDGVRALVRRR